jgi:hypothetical protein
MIVPSPKSSRRHAVDRLKRRNVEQVTLDHPIWNVVPSRGNPHKHGSTGQRGELRVTDIVAVSVAQMNPKGLKGLLSECVSYFLLSHGIVSYPT